MDAARHLQPFQNALGSEALHDLHEAQRVLFGRQPDAARQQRALRRERAASGPTRLHARWQCVTRQWDPSEVHPQRRKQYLLCGTEQSHVISQA